MCNPVFAALVGLAAGCGVPPAPAGLLAPADPRLAAIFHPPAAPTAGLKRYVPVEASPDWSGPPEVPTGHFPSGAAAGGDMSGPRDRGMKGMPGMGGR